jgi:heterodisulfide reductase subunit C
MLQSLLGLEEELLGPDSEIWHCTNCYSCYERCPQDVRPIEVIIALKNMAFARGTAPEEIGKFSQNIEVAGVAATVTASVHARRKELGLPELKPAPADELKELLAK